MTTIFELLQTKTKKRGKSHFLLRRLFLCTVGKLFIFVRHVRTIRELCVFPCLSVACCMALIGGRKEKKKKYVSIPQSKLGIEN